MWCRNNMFFKLLILPLLNMITTFCKVYHSMSFPFSVHIHQSYIFVLGLIKNIAWVVLFCLFCTYTKIFACSKMKSVSVLLCVLTVLLWPNRMRVGLTTTEPVERSCHTFHLNQPTKSAPKGLGVLAFPHLVKYAVLFWSFSLSLFWSQTNSKHINCNLYKCFWGIR